MNYQLHITSTAKQDITKAVDYIEFTLKNPDAANNLLDVVTEQINSLANFPQRFHLVDEPILASWDIRFIVINHYLAFYTIDEKNQNVIIVRFQIFVLLANHQFLPFLLIDFHYFQDLKKLMCRKELRFFL